jgi:excisionase family DNA binding protein
VPKQPREEWISVPAAAELLGCTDVWVLRLLKKGDLEGFRLSGRAWAVSRASAEKNLKSYLSRDPAAAGRRRSGLAG